MFGRGRRRGARGAETLHRYLKAGDRDSLDRAIDLGERLIARAEFAEEPAEVRGALLDSLALAYHGRHGHTGSAADLDTAIDLCRRALATGGDEVRSVLHRNNLGVCLLRRYELNPRLEDLPELVATWRAVVDATPDDSPRLPGRLTNLGEALAWQESHGEPGDIPTDEIVAVHTRLVRLTAAGDPELARHQNNAGEAHFRRFQHTADRTDLDTAARYLRTAVAGSDPADPDIRWRWVNLARVTRELGGEHAAEEAVDLVSRAILAAPTPVLDLWLWRQWRAEWQDELAALDGPDREDRRADVRQRAADLAGSGLAPEELSRRALAVGAAAVGLGVDDPAVADAVTTAGHADLERGRVTAAQDLFEYAVRIRIAAHGERHPAVAEARLPLAEAFRLGGDLASCAAQLRVAVRVLERTGGPEQLRAIVAMLRVAGLQRAAGEYDHALANMLGAVGALRRRVGPLHPDLGTALTNLGSLLLAMDRVEEALAPFEHAVVLLSERPRRRDGRAAIFWDNLGGALLRHGQLADARRCFDRAMEVYARVGDQAAPVDVTITALHLASALSDLDEHDGAREQLDLAHRLAAHNSTAAHLLPEIRAARSRLPRAARRGSPGYTPDQTAVVPRTATARLVAPLVRVLEAQDDEELWDLRRRHPELAGPEAAELLVEQARALRLSGRDEDAEAIEARARRLAAGPPDPGGGARGLPPGPAGAGFPPSAAGDAAEAALGRYERGREPADLRAAVTAARAAVEEPGPDHERAGRLHRLGYILMVQCLERPDRGALDEAPEVLGRVLALAPDDPGLRFRAGFHLANVHIARYDHDHELTDLRRAITLLDGLAGTRPDQSPDPEVLANLSVAVIRLVNATGERSDADRLLALCADPDHAARWSPSARAVAAVAEGRCRMALWRWDEDPRALDPAIAALRSGLAAADLDANEVEFGHADLGAALLSRFQLTGDPHDLAQGMEALETAHRLGGVAGDASLHGSMLCQGLLLRYRDSGAGADLEHAVRVGREALESAGSRSAERLTAAEQLGVALTERYRVTRDEDLLTEAIALFQEAEDATAGLGGSAAARVANNFGWALSERYELTGDEDDAGATVDHYRRALHLVGPDAPIRTTYLDNLGANLALAASRGHLAASLDEAVEVCAEAVAGTDREDRRWPGRMTNLAITRAARHDRDDRPQDRAAAVEGFRAVCADGLGRGGRHHLNAAVAWCGFALRWRAWQDTAAAAEQGLSILDRLVAGQHAPVHTLGWAREGQGLAARGGYALARLDRPLDAAVLLERGRALLLQQALGRDPGPLNELGVLGHDHLRRDYVAASEQVQALERRADDTPGPDSRAHLARAREELATVVARIRNVPGFENFLRPLTGADLLALAAEAPLVFLASTELGGLALTVRPTGADLDWLADPRLRTLQESVTAFLLHGDSDDEVTGWLWTAVMRHVVRRAAGAGTAVVIASGPLSLLPLHAAWRPDPAAATGRRYALDDVAIRYAPSAAAHRASVRRAADARADSVLVVADPGGQAGPELPYTRIEAELVRPLFPAGRTLLGPAAALDTVVGALAEHHVLHFACHGRYDPLQPLDSGLVLAAGQVLTLRRLIDQRLPDIRLAVLSACETSVPGIDVIDEALGLPAGLLAAGAAGVVGTLRPVPDAAAALVMARFHTEWRAGGISAPEALRAAQRWARDSTNAEKRAAFPQLWPEPALAGAALRLWRGARAYAAPRFWAPFCFVGT